MLLATLTAGVLLADQGRMTSPAWAENPFQEPRRFIAPLVERPTAEDRARLYPKRALQEGLAGAVVLRCSVKFSGRMDFCRPIQETPEGYGFGEAAQRLAKKYRLQSVVDGQSVRRGLIRLPVTFTPPGKDPGPAEEAEIEP